MPLRSPVARYGIAVVAYVVAAALRRLLEPLFGAQLPFITFYPAITVSAWYGGLGAGLTTTALGALTAGSFWLIPIPVFSMRGFAHDVALALYVFNGVVISGITELLHRANRRTRQAEQAHRHLAAIVESSDEAIFSQTVAGTITSWNRGAQRLFGYRADEAVGQPIALVFPGADDAQRRMLDRLAHGDAVEPFEAVATDRHGKRLDVSLTVSAIRDAGRIVEVSTIARDISEGKRVEEERARVLAGERVARVEAEAASQAKDHFLAMLGHELRTPLAAIVNGVQVLERAERLEGRVATIIGVLSRQGRQLTRLVDDLLDVARVTTGKIVLEWQSVELGALVRDCVDTITAVGRFDQHHVKVETEAAWVHGDRARLEQVVTNLVTNALRYTPPGGTIRLTVAPDGDQAALGVADTGIGIAPSMLPHVFELFVQGEHGGDRAPSGLGIGLTLVRRLVELHGGTVVAESAGQDRGSVFTCRFPLAAPAATGTAARAAAAIGAGRRRVLVVEDNDDARAMLRQLLQVASHDVQEAADAAHAIDLARAVAPDVVLIDIALPDADGYEVARRLRAIPECASAVLVAVSGYGLRENQDGARAAGFDAYLVKPVDLPQLERVLRRGDVRGRVVITP